MARETQQNQIRHIVIFFVSRLVPSGFILVMDTELFSRSANLTFTAVTIIDFIPVSAEIAFIKPLVGISGLFCFEIRHKNRIVLHLSPIGRMPGVLLFAVLWFSLDLSIVCPISISEFLSAFPFAIGCPNSIDFWTALRTKPLAVAVSFCYLATIFTY